MIKIFFCTDKKFNRQMKIYAEIFMCDLSNSFGELTIAKLLINNSRRFD